MKILFITNYFLPETTSASHLYYYLAKELIKRGHKVRVITGIPRCNVDKKIYYEYCKNNILIEEIDEIEIVRAKLPLVDRKRVARRGIEHFEIAYKLANCSIKTIKEDFDISLVYSPPLTLFWTANLIRSFLHIPYILNVQDLFPQYAIDLGVMKNVATIKFFKEIEKKAYLNANFITVHSEKNATFIRKLLPIKLHSKVDVIENWIDANDIKPGAKINPFSLRHNLKNKFVVSFGGTFGFSQDLEIILNSAYLTKDYEIYYVLVGEGVQKEKIIDLKEKMKLNKVLILPAVPKDEYPDILHTSELSLVTLKKDVKTPAVPSKILSILSAGIPVVGAMNLDGDAPKLIEKAKAGIVVPAGDAEAFANAIVKLYNDAKLREEYGKNGRKYVEENLSVEAAATKYEELFREVIRNYKGRKHKN